MPSTSSGEGGSGIREVERTEGAANGIAIKGEGIPLPLLLTAGATILAPLSSYSSNPVFYSLLYLLIITIAWLTNPSPSTFRTHLTSLSLHTHLRLLSAPSSAPPFSFSSRIALSVRTPPYSLQSYGLFSVVTMDEGERVWVGVLGRWWAWRVDEEKEERERKGRVEKGVDVLSSPPASTTPLADGPIATASSSVTQSINTIESGCGRNNICTTSTSGSISPARHPVPAKRSSRHGPRRSSSPIHRGGSTSPTTAQPKPTHIPSSQLTSPLLQSVSATPTSTDSAAALKLPVIPLNPAEERELDELKSQLEELQSTASDTDKRLQAELDELRSKKKDEDLVRADLRSKIRDLEDQKRAAELARSGADRELGERKTLVRDLEGKVKGVRDEMDKLEKKETDLVERKEKKKRERKEREKKLAEEVARKRAEVVASTNAVERLALKNESLERTLEVRSEVLRLRRDELMRAASGGNSRAASLYSLNSGPAHPNDYGFVVQPHQQNRSSSSLNLAHPPAQGFLEHRLAHQHTVQPPSNLSSIFAEPSFVPITGTLPSVDDIPSKFLPFDLGADNGPPTNGSAGSTGASRPKLSLPLQYLDSGLLASSEDLLSSSTGPLSPMTPHQASLIPSQLFEMLDEDDEDGDYFDDALDSPTRGKGPSTTSRSGMGLGLLPSLVNSTPSSPISPTAPAAITSFGLGLRANGAPVSPWNATSNEQFAALPALPPTSLSSSARLLPASLPSPTGSDLPRQGQGLSLNPDAKAFAFSLPPGTTAVPTAAPGISSPSSCISPVVSSPLGPGPGPSPSPGLVGAGLGTTSPQLQGATHSSSSSSSGGSTRAFAATRGDEGAPKSRMEFSSTRSAGMTHGASASLGGGGGGGSGLRWTHQPSQSQSQSQQQSPSALLPSSGGSTGVIERVGFNPFDDKVDDLLGPLKRAPTS